MENRKDIGYNDIPIELWSIWDTGLLQLTKLFKKITDAKKTPGKQIKEKKNQYAVRGSCSIFIYQ